MKTPARWRSMVALVVAVAWLLGGSLPVSAHGTPQEKKAQAVKDPVCGMKLETDNQKLKSEYKGKTYYFCSSDCKQKFDKEPAKYAEKTPDTSTK